MTGPAGMREWVEADRRCLDAAEILLDSLSDHPSPIGLRRFEEALAEARKQVGVARPGKPFEDLFARHLLDAWQALEAVVRYRFDLSLIHI